MREKLPLFLKLSALLTVLFVVVYGGTNWINSQRAEVHRLYFDWELGIPFVPWMIYVYASLNVYLGLTLFLLDAPGLKLYAKTFALTTLVGGAVHLALPTRLGFERPAIGIISSLDLPYNLVPSMHVTYGTMTARILCLGRSETRPTLLVWLLLMIASVLLVHQHHLLDVVTGVALGLAAGAYYRHERRSDGTAQRSEHSETDPVRAR